MSRLSTCNVSLIFLLLPSSWMVCCLAYSTVDTIKEKSSRASPSRRSFFRQTAAITAAALSSSGVSLLPTVAHADEPKNAYFRPRAPKEALLPISRLKIWFDNAYQLSANLKSGNGDDNQYESLVKLNNILTNPPKLFYSESPKSQQNPMMNEFMAQLAPTRRGGAPPSPPPPSDFTKSSSSSSNRIMSILNQADVQRQWNMLQYTESKLENTNDIRAAFNYYTSRLQFNSNAYKLEASKEDKKRLIRDEGGLPSVTAVVVSDLDLRDLYRNTFLTTLDDVGAEVLYQLKERGDSSSTRLDVADVVELMEKANTALTNWFNLIDPSDVQDAMDAVVQEETKS